MLKQFYRTDAINEVYPTLLDKDEVERILMGDIEVKLPTLEERKKRKVEMIKNQLLNEKEEENKNLKSFDNNKDVSSFEKL
jgi:hypothetical protein